MFTLILIGLLVGVLSSLLGVGGGFLLVPYLIALGKKASLAVGTAFLFIVMVSLSALVGHGRLGNVDIKTGLLLGLGGVLGAQLGPLLLAQVADVWFKRGFALVLITLGGWLLWSTREVG